MSCMSSFPTVCVITTHSAVFSLSPRNIYTSHSWSTIYLLDCGCSWSLDITHQLERTRTLPPAHFHSRSGTECLLLLLVPEQLVASRCVLHLPPRPPRRRLPVTFVMH
ncbi:hypothetical protein K440DRAFT_313232 [Wilcoxina mikolae CBS 423.85]|nr:hypothetical protein K440DRAFT_313232 [Wilcoxina mikolae CBS 423.85]